MEKKQEVTGSSYTVDDEFIGNVIEEKLSTMDLDTLYQVRRKLEEEGEDTDLIDKAIAIHKQNQKKEDSSLGDFLLGTFLGLSSGKKKKRPSQEKEYEPWNLEEEELEEDDYHFDDLD